MSKTTLLDAAKRFGIKWRCLTAGGVHVAPTARAAAKWRRSRNVVDVAVTVIVRLNHRFCADD
jgi:hypothetical protein